MSEHGRPPSPDQAPQRHASQGQTPFAGDAAYPNASDPYRHSPYGSPPDPPAASSPPQQGRYQQAPYQQAPYQQAPYQQAPYQQGWSYQQSHPQPADRGREPMPPSPHQPGYRLSSDQFKPPTSHTPLLITAIVVAVVLAVVATGAFVAWRSDHPTAAPTPTPSTSVPIPSSSGNSIQFVSDSGSGTLTIVHTRWSNDGLMVEVKLSCTDGQVQHGTFNFKAFDENGTLYNSSIEGAPHPPMSEGTIYRGESVTGWLTFTVPRQDMTLLLISEYGDAITAFAIKG